MVEVVIITGATASGKSARALEYARTHNGVIINADALQQYADLPILSARPREYDGIGHELYGFLDPFATSDAKQWCTMAVQAVERAIANGQTPIIVGGTGMYLYSLIHGLSPMPDLPKPAPTSTETPLLYRQLQLVDPQWAGQIQPTDRQRIIRGLHVFHHTNRPLSDWHNEPPIAYLKYPYKMMHITCPPEQNRLNIQQRLERDFAQMQDEMLKFCQKYPNLPENTPIFRIIGAWNLWQLAHGRATSEQVKAEIYHLTCQYAKRQRTFLRNKLAIGNKKFYIGITERI